MYVCVCVNIDICILTLVIFEGVRRPHPLQRHRDAGP